MQIPHSNFFVQKRISYHSTLPYSPELNGVAEKLKRSLGKGTRAMLLSFKDKRLWAEVMKTFIYIKTRLSHTSVNEKIPYKIFCKMKPSIIHLNPFGREYFVHTTSNMRPSGSKLLLRAEKGIYVRYTEVNHQYRIFSLDKRQTIISTDIKFLPYGSKTLDENLIAYPQMKRAIQSKSLTTETSPPHERQLESVLNISSQDPNQADLTESDLSPISSIEITSNPPISSQNVQSTE
ncbi:hypothetical protein K3495_g316 [Podosphaera aphanis]|nr:hypothetical protein K3495_g316 [Podosphaera aphanis]